jgi:hypothetical protein
VVVAPGEVKLALAAGTDAALFVLHDPTLLGALESKPGSDSESALLRAAVKEGRLLTYSYAADGDSLMHAYVDELPRRRVMRRVQQSTRGRLRIASGRLRYSGVEYLGRDAGKSGTEVTLPAGDYEVTVHETDWGDVPENHAEKAARRAVGPRGRFLSALGGFGCGCSVVMALGIAAALWALNQSEPAPDFWRWVKLLVGGWLAWFAVSVFLNKLPSSRRVDEARHSAWLHYPDLVLVLKPLAPADAALPGCSVGEWA